MKNFCILIGISVAFMTLVTGCATAQSSSKTPVALSAPVYAPADNMRSAARYSW